MIAPAAVPNECPIVMGRTRTKTMVILVKLRFKMGVITV